MHRQLKVLPTTGFALFEIMIISPRELQFLAGPVLSQAGVGPE